MERMQEPFAFTGNARDYFRIWIVNLFLTIVTLGLYSPWAKVRKKRYLYGHTWLAGSNFDYHGNPWAILKGRLVAFTAFVAYTLATHFSPRAGAIVLLVMMPAIPWLILRSFAFNAANSSWRHLRFGYEGRYADALRAIVPFLPIPIATILFPLEQDRIPTSRDVVVALLPSMIFLAFYPYVRARLVHLRLDGTRLGEERCRCTLRTSSFYGVYVIAALLVMGLGVFAGLAASVAGLAAVFSGSPDLGMTSPSVSTILSRGPLSSFGSCCMVRSSLNGASSLPRDSRRPKRFEPSRERSISKRLAQWAIAKFAVAECAGRTSAASDETPFRGIGCANARSGAVCRQSIGRPNLRRKP